MVTSTMVRAMVKGFVNGQDEETRVAGEGFLEIVTMMDFPEFITTLLNDSHEFRKRQNVE